MMAGSIRRGEMAETEALPRPAEKLDRGPRYEEDLFLWSRHQGELMRAGRLDLVDWENVAEEIESLGKSDRRELGRRLKVLMVHLLKWQFQPEQRSTSWRGTIRDQRDQMADLLADSPSLRSDVAAIPRRKYWNVVITAAEETDLSARIFPADCPYTADQLLDDNFFPGPIEER
jgi:Domain of unknown function DUF29